MSAHWALECTQWLLTWSVVIQTVEHWALRHSTNAGVWHWPTQALQLQHQNPLLVKVLNGVFRARPYATLLFTRALAAVALVLGGGTWAVVVLVLCQLLMLIRFRGTFNGGSDFMTLMVTMGVALAHCLSPVLGEARALMLGLWWIALQSMTSYFVSGAVKMRVPEWRSGAAMSYFVDRALRGPLPLQSLLLNPWFARLGAWAFMAWEVAVPAILLGPPMAAAFCTVAATFHLLVFRYFGLNRFVWAWVATFPALMYASTFKPLWTWP